MAGVAGKGIANVKIRDKGHLEETPREQGCAAGVMRSRASLVSGVRGTGQLCGVFPAKYMAVPPLREEGWRWSFGGGRGWRGSSSCLEAVGTLCWSIDPRGSTFPPHAGACPPMPVPVHPPGTHGGHRRASIPGSRSCPSRSDGEPSVRIGGAWENCSLPDAELWASAVFPDFTTAARCIFGL